MQYLKMVDDEVEMDLNQIRQYKDEGRDNLPNENEPIKIELRIEKDAYFDKIKTMLSHIHRGDIYEANFCQEFYAEDTVINPLEIYNKLNAISKPPFATFFKAK